MNHKVAQSNRHHVVDGVCFVKGCFADEIGDFSGIGGWNGQRRGNTDKGRVGSAPERLVHVIVLTVYATVFFREVVNSVNGPGRKA